MTAATRGDARRAARRVPARATSTIARRAAAYGDGGARGARRARSTSSSRVPRSASSGSRTRGDGAARVDGRRVRRLLRDLDVARHARRQARRRHDPRRTGRGAASAARCWRRSAQHLRAQGVTRIDCGCHRDNAGAWRFYERLGFRPLDEERIALLLVTANSADARAPCSRWSRPPAAAAASAATLPKQYALLGGRAAARAHARPAARGARRSMASPWSSRAPDDAHYDARDRRARRRRGRCAAAARRAPRPSRNALAALRRACRDDDWILVHDAARPCVPRRCAARGSSRELARRRRRRPARRSGRRHAEARATATPTRRACCAPRTARGLWQAQTPQMFRYGVLRARVRARRRAATAPTRRRRSRRCGSVRAPRLVRGQPGQPQGHLSRRPRARGGDPRGAGSRSTT